MILSEIWFLIQVYLNFLKYAPDDFIIKLSQIDFDLEIMEENIFILNKIGDLDFVKCIINFKGSEEDLIDYIKSLKYKISPKNIFLRQIFFQNTEDPQERKFINSIMLCKN